MTVRGVALLVIAGLALLSAAGACGAAVMESRHMPLVLVMLAAGPSFACGAWALLGLAWRLAEGLAP